jgi:hypothetical protein
MSSKIIQLIIERLTITPVIELKKLAFYVISFLYCMWNQTEFVKFDTVVNNYNQNKLEEILLVNIPKDVKNLGSFFFPIVLLISFHMKKFADKMDIYSNFFSKVLEEVEQDPDVKLLFNGNELFLFKKKFINNKSHLHLENQISLEIMTEESFKEKWNDICSKLTFMEKDSLLVVLKNLLVNLSSLESEKFEFSYQSLVNGWGVEMFILENNLPGLKFLIDCIS